MKGYLIATNFKKFKIKYLNNTKTIQKQEKAAGKRIFLEFYQILLVL
jgi:hypothetical protein